MVWRDGRVAEGGGLLNRCTVKSRTGGSNPPLSAIFHSNLNRIKGSPGRVARVHLVDFSAVVVELGLISYLDQAGLQWAGPFCFQVCVEWEGVRSHRTLPIVAACAGTKRRPEVR